MPTVSPFYPAVRECFWFSTDRSWFRHDQCRSQALRVPARAFDVILLTEAGQEEITSLFCPAPQAVVASVPGPLAFQIRIGRNTWILFRIVEQSPQRFIFPQSLFYEQERVLLFFKVHQMLSQGANWRRILSKMERSSPVSCALNFMSSAVCLAVSFLR